MINDERRRVCGNCSCLVQRHNSIISICEYGICSMDNSSRRADDAICDSMKNFLDNQKEEERSPNGFVFVTVSPLKRKINASIDSIKTYGDFFVTFKGDSCETSVEESMETISERIREAQK